MMDNEYTSICFFIFMPYVLFIHFCMLEVSNRKIFIMWSKKLFKILKCNFQYSLVDNKVALIYSTATQHLLYARACE